MNKLKALFSRTTIFFDISGFALVSWGIGLFSVPFGVIAGGVSLLLMGWRLSDE